jgi:hypothetical protein
LSATNITGSVADQCVGCIETKRGTASFRFFVIDHSSAASHNGGLCLRSLDSFAVIQCIIARCRHISSEGDAAAALLVYENPYDSELSDGQFVGNVPDRSFTLTVVSGHSLVVANCRFSGNATKEVHDKNIVMRNCRFEQHRVETIGVLIPGYNKSVKMAPSTIPPRRTPRRKAGLSALVFGAAFVVAAGIAGALLMVQLAALRVIRLVVRRPRALADRRQASVKLP